MPRETLPPTLKSLWQPAIHKRRPHFITWCTASMDSYIFAKSTHSL